MNEAFKGTGGILRRLDFVSIPQEVRRQEVAICGGVIDNEGFGSIAHVAPFHVPNRSARFCSASRR